MHRIRPLPRALFASGVIGVGLRFGDFAGVVQEFPTWVPPRQAIVVVLAGAWVVAASLSRNDRTTGRGIRRAPLR